MSGSKGVAAAMSLAACLLISAPLRAAQGRQDQPGNQSGQQPNGNPQQQKPTQPGSSLDVPSAANSEEEAAAKAFTEVPNSDNAKKISTGEEFLRKYPDSQYRPVIYSALTYAYIRAGNPEKAFEVGDKEVAMKPDDVQTMAILSQTIPRVMNASTPEPEKRLAKAENYGKRAIEITPTISKPAGIGDQNFIIAKNVTLAMAHSGLGLVYFRRGKFDDAIPEFEQSVKIDPNPTPDPVNLYLLGMSNEKASHFDAAAAAYTKCAELAGNLQTPCKNGADEAKKKAGTQLSTPK